MHYDCRQIPYRGKQWILSYCEKTGKDVHCYRVKVKK